MEDLKRVFQKQKQNFNIRKTTLNIQNINWQIKLLLFTTILFITKKQLQYKTVLLTILKKIKILFQLQYEYKICLAKIELSKLTGYQFWM